MNSFKLTLKLLQRNKIFSVITILGMAIPLMFLMIIITSVSHFTSYSSPETDFGRVVYVDELKFSIKRPNGFEGNMTGKPSYDYIKNYVKVMKSPERVGVISSLETYNIYLNNKKQVLKAAFTDDDFWLIADFNFIEGRAFSKSEVENAQLVAVIDESTKNMVFGDENAVGKKMKIFKRIYTITGVVKNVDISHQYTHSNIWMPITTSEKYLVKDIFAPGCTALLLAKTKSHIPQIQAEYSQRIKNFPLGSYEGLTKISGELSTDSYYKKIQRIFQDLFSFYIKESYILYLAYGIIFFFFILLPSINLFYIHSSRINERSSEIGVRKSFGGSKRVISNQFIIENVFISLISGLIGFVFALVFFWFINKSKLIPGLSIVLSVKSLAFCVSMWLVFGIISGILPALRMSHIKIIAALNQQEMHKKVIFFTRKIRRLKILLIVEFALSFISLALILTFIFHFQKNNTFPLGFDFNNVYQISANNYDENDLGWFGESDMNQEISETIKSKKFVEYYGKWESNEPYHDGHTIINCRINYKDKELKDEFYCTFTGENMDKIFKLHIIDGRWFNKSDEGLDNTIIVLDESCKQKIFGDNRAVGESIDICGNKCMVIGVIDHYKYHGEFSLPVCLIFAKGRFNNLNINSYAKEKTDFFRVKPGTNEETVNEMAKNLSQKFPNLEINISSLSSVRKSYFHKTLGPIIVVSVLFFLILLIVLMGLFGVLWYDISLRKSEIGVRRASGATSGKIFILIVKEMLVWASAGIALGILLFIQVPLLNLLSIEWNNGIYSAAIAALIIIVLVIICTLIPARQAAKIQPAEALYEE